MNAPDGQCDDVVSPGALAAVARASPSLQTGDSIVEHETGIFCDGCCRHCKLKMCILQCCMRRSPPVVHAAVAGKGQVTYKCTICALRHNIVPAWP